MEMIVASWDLWKDVPEFITMSRRTMAAAAEGFLLRESSIGFFFVQACRLQNGYGY
jgi:hypothetical protein